jgi:hypothetical protein
MSNARSAAVVENPAASMITPVESFELEEGPSRPTRIARELLEESDLCVLLNNVRAAVEKESHGTASASMYINIILIAQSLILRDCGL